ncbi:glycine C-acetyltransferase [Stagnihabitans tardus]|uniref:2-amino-3-ketobutyrate coenzyme A ligase n=1 Tax=Stagnihabitans tardus TaxID=2699202 RepID=A0AAE4Y7J3_9RHOB|nr:glycine C-acetyltransferase [Stagnihabitans tardus]NBZ86261.1 glycine C-acetyltransferase [Stagnihabitans tardus]
MADEFLDHIGAVLKGIEAEGLMKREREITSPQGARVTVARPGEPGRRMLNLCANNYLGLADDPRLVAAAEAATRSHGYGMASVRFICGTTDLHRALERRLAAWLGHEDSILFAACFDANGAVFEPLLGEEDAVISDSLNHASIIDGIRLCKARRFRFANGDMADLEAQLRAAREGGARFVMVATDGVFSMDGYFADLGAVRRLCDAYGALLMVDDCHATGFVGPKGRGTPARAGIAADILTGTFGKALGGALGGYVAGAQPVIDLLRQRARPYLFSNALPPAVVGAALAAIDIAEAADDRRAQLSENAAYWRAGLEALGFSLLPGSHPIVPVMLGDAPLAQSFARELDAEGVMVSAFFFPVVPRGKARIRTQMNAALTREDLDFGLAAFGRAGKAVGVL